MVHLQAAYFGEGLKNVEESKAGRMKSLSLFLPK